jgi:hypothetical protein
MTQARSAAFAANAAAREVNGSAKEAANAVGQAVEVAHVAAHELGAAAYAIRATRAAAPKNGYLVSIMVDFPDPESCSEVCLWPKPLPSSGIRNHPSLRQLVFALQPELRYWA